MAQTNLTIRIDSELKREAEALFNRVGLNMSSAIHVFFRQAVGAQAIPFELKVHNDYKNKIEESIRQADEGKLIYLTDEEMEAFDDMDIEAVREFLTTRRKETRA
jgi:DNA-damage-inducible protein J